MFFFYMLIFVSSAISMDVVTIGNQVFSEEDFFKKYGRGEWERSDSGQ